MTGQQRTWLTADAFERLREELTVLRRQDRGAEQDDAVGEQRRQARIRRLEEILHSAVVGEAPPDDGIAEPGMVLTVRFDDDPGTETFLLGVRDGGDADGLEVYSPESPLGRALAGARQGESRTYQVPSGATVRVTLVRAVPYGQH
ncbi:transcription elongation factor GreAB [Prauserella flavalba]|uniref:Transcription elongation factor GreAB n=2 Tax=Prauserella flavalba TaxID=1477506 RepID=A0A318M309_9PSEU|nr:GreA/GreB family elongation factor [Prauserella flavalba]PXY36945.1 transcription elongation factor GreAB [Prauserella flavalba]